MNGASTSSARTELRSIFGINGMNVEEVIAEYPQLTEEDIRASIAYGAEMTRERYVEIPTKATG